MSPVYHLTVSSLRSFHTFVIRKNSLSFQGLLIVTTLEYETVQRIYGPKIRYCVGKVEGEKFDDKELYDLHHLNLMSVMRTNIYTYD
jgi:hypothetical protein